MNALELVSKEPDRANARGVARLHEMGQMRKTISRLERLLQQSNLELGRMALLVNELGSVPAREVPNVAA